MRAASYRRTGDPDVIEIGDVPTPAPGPGEVLVRMHRAGVNPTDWKSRRGSAAGKSVEPPQIPGQDGSGVVEAVGEGVEPALRGLRVWLWEAAYERRYGTAAEFSLVPRRHAVVLPDSASFETGASLGVPFITAHRCLTVAEHGPHRLGPGALDGRVVLVAGGAGAVGNAVIQLARWADARIIATVSSPEKSQLAGAAGADHVINYREQDVVREVKRIVPHGVHSIAEVSPAVNAGIDVQVLATNGSVAIYANNGGADVTLPIRPAMQTNARWQFVLLYTAPGAAKAQAVEDIYAALQVGAIRTGRERGLPVHHFPLEQTADAHAAVESGAIGKVLIDVVD